jgi:hypothetical protein
MQPSRAPLLIGDDWIVFSNIWPPFAADVGHADVSHAVQQLKAAGKLQTVGGESGYGVFGPTNSLAFLTDPDCPVAAFLLHSVRCQELSVRMVAPGGVQVECYSVRVYERSGHGERLVSLVSLGCGLVSCCDWWLAHAAVLRPPRLLPAQGSTATERRARGPS